MLGLYTGGSESLGALAPHSRQPRTNISYVPIVVFRRYRQRHIDPGNRRNKPRHTSHVQPVLFLPGDPCNGLRLAPNRNLSPWGAPYGPF